jgi:NTE family protein
VTVTRATIGPSFFDGLSEGDVEWILGHLELRLFEAGETLLAEGDAPSDIYIIQSGQADVFMADDRGEPHRLNRVGPGAGLGEMSVFTGRPVSATVVAVTDLVVGAMTTTEFRRIAAMFPRVYENLGAALAERLVESNRRSVRETTAHVTALVDGGAPPILAYALAASVAFHTGQPALLFPNGEPTGDLALLARDAAPPADPDLLEGRAYIGDPAAFGENLDEAVVKATALFPHVLAIVADDGALPVHAHRTLRLGTEHDSAVTVGGASYVLRAWVDAERRRRPDIDRELRIPRLNADDEAGLRAGILPLSTPAGSQIGIAARDVADARVGVALGGGAIRGWAHIGVLAALEEKGVPIDFIVGTSIGAIVASSYGFGHNPAETEEALYRASAKIFKPRLPRRAILSNKGVKHGLASSYGDALIEETATPLAITATDIGRLREIVLRTGLLWEAALASASIPGVFPPLRVGPYMLVDGGVVNPVPSNVLADMGANILIGVKLTRSLTGGTTRDPDREPGLLDIFTSTFELMQSKITSETAAASTLLIEPSFADNSGFGLRQFPQGRRYIPNGHEAVEAALPRLSAALPWLRRRSA